VLSGGGATAVTPSGATLTGAVNPNGWATSGCQFEWGQTAAYGNSVPCSSSPGASLRPVAVTGALTGLTAGTSYHFRLQAVTAAGTAVSGDQTFATLPTPPVVPPAPPPPGPPVVPVVPITPGHPRPAIWTLGILNVGRHTAALSPGLERVNAYRLIWPGEMLGLTVYLQPRARSGPERLTGIVYRDRNGKPDRLLAQTRSLSIHATTRAGWYRLSFRRPLAMHAGRYWFGLANARHSTGTVSIRYQPTPRSGYHSTSRHNGQSTRLRPFTADNHQMSLYASYRATPTR
jgi:hypothetical protein